MKRNIFLAAALLALIVVRAHAQDPEEMNNFRIAEALEQSGEYQKALGFYKRLHDANPTNFMYFEGLRRTYLVLKQYQEVEQLIWSRIRLDSTNVVLYCQLADAYYKAGAADSAFVSWNRALALSPENPSTYRAVAGFMVNNRLFDRAIDVYRKADELPGTKDSFVTDIARLYLMNMNYRESMKELLKLLQIQNHTYALSYIESQIGAYASSKDALSQFTSQMEAEVSDSSSNVEYRRILAFLYMEEKNYVSAYDVYKWLDHQSATKGSELIGFADRAYNDEAFDVAANSYLEVSNVGTDKNIVAQALVGYGNSLFMMGAGKYADEDRPCAAGDTLAELNTALRAYAKVMSSFPASPFLAESVLKSIEIRMKFLKDYPGAEKLFSDFGGAFPPNDIQSRTLRVRLFMAEGNLQTALDNAIAGIELCGASSSDDCDEFKYESAFVLYLLGKYDSANYYLGKINTDPKSDAANESIQLQNLISDNSGSPDALKKYAQANSMEVANRIPEAVTLYEEILKEYSQVPLADNARLALADDYCLIGKTNEALKYYSILSQDSTGIFADRAQFKTARIYEVTLHEKQKAISLYQNFLERFPNSIYQDKVRSILAALTAGNS